MKMKININFELDKEKTLIEQILEARGLTKDWLDAGEESLLDFSIARNYEKGKELLLNHITTNSTIGILVDSDQDGFTSSAIMYQWLLDKNPKLEIIPIIPEGKVHGIIESLIPDCDLLIIPDGSSSEPTKHKNVYHRDIDILVLDHHEMEKEDDYSVIINPKNSKCDYPNKDLSGAGVVWKFIRQIDLEKGEEDYSKYIDLAAIGIVGDVMSLKPMENKAIVNIGTEKISNPYFKAYLKADPRAQGKSINPTLISFYMAPLVNALIRIGDQEQKEELFKAMVGEIAGEPLIASLISTKGKQDRKQNTALPRIVMGIQRNNREDNNVILGESPITLPKSMTGLVAGRLASMYQRPTIIGRRKDGKFIGSLRSINDSSVEDFRSFCDECDLVDWAKGHPAAAGIQIPEENIEKFLEYAQENLPDFEKVITCDFELPDENQGELIRKACEFEDHVGCDIPQVRVYKKLDLNPMDFQLIGRNNNVLKIEHNGITYIQFRYNGEIPDRPVTVEIVGAPNLNNWNGVVTPQLIIKEMDFGPIIL